MKVYKFDKDGYFAGVHDCQPCPLTYGWLYPTEGTFTEIAPKDEVGYIPKWDGKKWDNIKNYFQKPLYDIVEKNMIFSNTVTLPEGYTDIKPTDVQKWDGQKWVDDPALIAEKEKKQKFSELSATDFKMSRQLEDVMDVLIANEKLSKKDLPEKTRDFYELKKKLRAEYNKLK